MGQKLLCKPSLVYSPQLVNSHPRLELFSFKSNFLLDFEAEKNNSAECSLFMLMSGYQPKHRRVVYDIIRYKIRTCAHRNIKICASKNSRWRILRSDIFCLQDPSGEDFEIILGKRFIIGNIKYPSLVMLMRKLILATNCLLNKQISNISYRHHGKRILLSVLCSGNDLNAHFYTGKVAEKPMVYHSSFLHNNKLCNTALNKRRNTLNRFYSGDPSITFLSGGKSKYFEDSAVYDEDRLLNKVTDQLKEDNGIDICVIETSEERRKYADYVVVVSGRSTRHLKAMTSHIHQQVLIF